MAPQLAGKMNAKAVAAAAKPATKAFVTFLAGDEDYLKGVVGLAKGLRKVGSAYPLVVAVLPDVPERHRRILLPQGCIVREIVPVYPPENQTQFAMAYYVINFSKLRIWEFVEYERMVYLDADIEVFENIDELFELPMGHFYAAELGPPPALYFNAGMFVHEPSMATAKALLDTLRVLRTTPFTEQDFLNMFFREQYKPMPLVYNNLVLEMLRRHPRNVQGRFRPNLNAATDCPVHVVRIPHDDDDDDSGSSVVQEEEAGGTNPPHVALFMANSELPTPSIPEDASFTAHVQEASYLLPPQDGTESFVGQNSTVVVMEIHAAQHVLPPIEPRGHDKWWRICVQLPMRNNELLAFLVKASELSIGGMLTFTVGGFIAAYYSKQDLGGMAKSVHETIGGKICFSFVNLAMCGYTIWVCSMAKAAEHNRSDPGKLPVQVIVIFSYLVLLGAFMMQCVTGAAIWKIAPGVAVVIAIMLVAWAMTFNRPKILRLCCFSWCCCGKDPEAASAEAIEDEAVARAYTDRSGSAITAYAAHDRLEKEAAIAERRADEARQAHAEAEQEVAAAKKRAEKALSDLQIAQPVNDEAAADSGEHEAENVAAFTTAMEAVNVYRAAQKAAAHAKERALETAADADSKKKEAEEAATVARRESRRVAAAKGSFGVIG